MNLYKILFSVLLIFIFNSCREKLDITEAQPTFLEPVVHDVGRFILEPNGADEIKMGSRFKIYWVVPEGVSKVNLYLYHDGELLSTIVTGTWNDGQYKWQVPNEVQVSRKYQIKIESNTDPSINGFSHKFLITN